MLCSCGTENPDSAVHCQQCGRSLRRRPWGRLACDAAAAAGLVLALVLVYLWDRSHVAAAPDPSPLRLAVTPHEYDDVGKLLGTLGAGYRFTQLSYDDLLNAERLNQFDVVFLTCGGVPSHWVGDRVGESQRDGAGTYLPRPDVVRSLREALRAFVGRGGTLYVSDLHFQILDLAFPEFIDRHLAAEGAVQTVQAQVVDPGLKRRLGPAIPLSFDKAAWRPAAFQGADVEVLLRGDYRLLNGVATSGPLLVQFPFEDGAVIFTSFHNEKQNSETEQELLRYLVFASVTAREGVKVNRTLVRGGLSPSERNLLSASSGEVVAQEYRRRRSGPLQFVLAFQNHGARLRLTVVGPDGARREETGTQTFQIDIPDAARGLWQYSITPLEVPYANFPFTLTIGEKR